MDLVGAFGSLDEDEGEGEGEGEGCLCDGMGRMVDLIGLDNIVPSTSTWQCHKISAMLQYRSMVRDFGRIIVE